MTTPVRYAHCSNDIEHDDPDRLWYENCPGRLAFEPTDRYAACPECGATCGSLVADYEDPAGPWPEAVAQWHAEVAKLRR